MSLASGGAYAVDTDGAADIYMDIFFQSLAYFVNLAIIGLIIAAIVLMVLRLLLNYADLNPFSRPVLLVRSLTDPFVNPVRRSLMNFGFSPNRAWWACVIR
ncbi:MAG: YggT family protein [Acidobacteria bacterium]|nr:YggT family protein [Acidobacteriota bacterium]